MKSQYGDGWWVVVVVVCNQTPRLLGTAIQLLKSLSITLYVRPPPKQTCSRPDDELINTIYLRSTLTVLMFRLRSCLSVGPVCVSDIGQHGHSLILANTIPLFSHIKMTIWKQLEHLIFEPLLKLLPLQNLKRWKNANKVVFRKIQDETWLLREQSLTGNFLSVEIRDLVIRR